MDDTTERIDYTPGLSRRQGSQDRFTFSDRLGSARFLTDGAGAVTNGMRFDGYGRKTNEGGGNWHPTEFGWGGWGYYSEPGNDAQTGLVQMGHRYYDAEVGRFLTPDPIGHAGGLNLYAYCGNDPVNTVDPLGLQGTKTYQVKIYRYPGAPGYLGRHASIYVSEPNGRAGRWYGFYPERFEDTDSLYSWRDSWRNSIGSTSAKLVTGPGYIHMPDTPKALKEGNELTFLVSPETASFLRQRIARMQKDQNFGKPRRYNLQKYNCSSWAGEVLQPLFDDLTEPVNDPTELFRRLEAYDGEYVEPSKPLTRLPRE